MREHTPTFPLVCSIFPLDFWSGYTISLHFKIILISLPSRIHLSISLFLFSDVSSSFFFFCLLSSSFLVTPSIHVYWCLPLLILSLSLPLSPALLTLSHFILLFSRSLSSSKASHSHYIFFFYSLPLRFLRAVGSALEASFFSLFYSLLWSFKGFFFAAVNFKPLTVSFVFLFVPLFLVHSSAHSFLSCVH